MVHLTLLLFQLVRHEVAVVDGELGQALIRYTTYILRREVDDLGRADSLRVRQ